MAAIVYGLAAVCVEIVPSLIYAGGILQTTDLDAIAPEISALRSRS